MSRIFLVLAVLGLLGLSAVSHADSPAPANISAPPVAKPRPSPWIPDPVFRNLGSELAVLRHDKLYLIGVEQGHEKILSALDLPGFESDPRSPGYRLMEAVGHDDLALFLKRAACKCVEVTRVHRGADGTLALIGTVRVMGITPLRSPDAIKLSATDRSFIVSFRDVLSPANADAAAAGFKQYSDGNASATKVPATRLGVDFEGNMAHARSEFVEHVLVCSFVQQLPACSLHMLESQGMASLQPERDSDLAYVRYGQPSENVLARIPYGDKAGEWFRINENIPDNNFYGPFVMDMSDGSILAVVDNGTVAGGWHRYALAHYPADGDRSGGLRKPELTQLPDGARPDDFVRLLGDKRLYYMSGGVGKYVLNAIGWGGKRIEFSEPLPFGDHDDLNIKRNGIVLMEKNASGYRARCASVAGGTWRPSDYANLKLLLKPADVFGWTSEGAKFDVVGLLEGGKGNQRDFDASATIQVLTCEAGELQTIGGLHLSDVLAQDEQQAQFQINGKVIYALTASSVTAFEIRSGSKPSLAVLGRVATPPAD